MPKYANFDATISTLQPVLGWYDTDSFTYKNLPLLSNLLEVSQTEWSTRISNAPWGILDGKLVPNATFSISWAVFQMQAQCALAKSDTTIVRCYENGVPVPAAWVAYRKSLRDIISASTGTVGTLPTVPTYPSGT